MRLIGVVKAEKKGGVMGTIYKRGQTYWIKYYKAIQSWNTGRLINLWSRSLRT